MNRLKLLTFDVANTILKIKDSPGYQYSAVAKNFGIIIKASDLDKVYEFVMCLF